MTRLLSFRDWVMRETVILARFSLITLICIFFAAGCTDLSEYDNRQIQEALSDSLFTTTESIGVQTEIIEDGILKLRLTGSHTVSINTETQNLTKISGPVHIDIFDDRGRLTTQVDSDSAVNYPAQSEFELFGHVKVVTSDKKRLWADYLKWERSSDQVSTPGNVTIVTPSDSINARGFNGKSDLSQYVLRQVTGETVLD